MSSEDSKKFTKELTQYLGDKSNDSSPVGPLMIGITKHLESKGFSYHRKQATLTLLGFVSAYIGENITMIISEQPGVDGLSFLSTIAGIIPDVCKSEFSELTKPMLVHNPELLKNKTAVALNPTTIKKNRSILKVLVSCGQVNDQTIGKSNGLTSINETQIQGPTSIIILVGESTPSWLNDFPALRIELDTNPDHVLEQLSLRKKRPDPMKEHSIQSLLKKEIERLNEQEVEIPYLHQIINSLDPKNTDSITIVDTIIKLLKVITIMNRATFATPEEMCAGYYDLPETVSTRNQSLIEHKNASQSDPPAALKATKVEYYILYNIINGIFNLNRDQVTGTVRYVYEAIKSINSTYLFSMTMLKPETVKEAEFIQALDHQTGGRGWAEIVQIKEKMLKDNGIDISDASVRRGVKELLDREYISRVKAPNRPNKFLYAVTTLSLDNEFSLPKPSTIIDSKYIGKAVEVINPLTGKKELI